MNTPKKCSPALRFVGFTDDWEQRKLGEIAQFSKGQGYSKSDISSSGYPIILYGSLYTDYKTVIDRTNTFVKDDINSIKSIGNEVIVPASGETPEDIARASAVLRKEIILGGDLNIIRPLLSKLEPVFLALSISYGTVKTELSKKAQGKSVVHIRNSDLQNIIINYPKLKEQTLIGSFFKQLDETIALHKRKLKKHQNLKKFYLEKMFPKENERFPKIRFPNFNDAWEQRKLGEVFEEYSEKNHEELPALMVVQGSGTIHRDQSERNLMYDKTNLSSYKMVQEGDFIVHLRSFEGGLEMATNNGIISPAYHVLHGKNTDSKFYYSYFRSKKFIEIDLKPHVYGIRDGRSINIEGMKTINIPYTNFNEQTQIGNFFKQLDETIALHKRKIEKLEKIKQAYLEKMFI